MQNKDKRVKLMNEILSGVKVLKLYGWERSFMAQVLGIRDNEIKVLKKTGYMSAMLSFVSITIPFLVTLVCFTTYIFMDGGNILTPDKVNLKSYAYYATAINYSFGFLPGLRNPYILEHDPHANVRAANVGHPSCPGQSVFGPREQLHEQ